MTHINLIVNSLPRDLLEFVFFLAVGFTAGSIGIIWFTRLNLFFFFKSKSGIHNLLTDINRIKNSTLLNFKNHPFKSK